MFLLKKILSPFFMPVSLVLVLALAGLFCLWLKDRSSEGTGGQGSGVARLESGVGEVR